MDIGPSANDTELHLQDLALTKHGMISFVVLLQVSKAWKKPGWILLWPCNASHSLSFSSSLSDDSKFCCVSCCIFHFPMNIIDNWVTRPSRGHSDRKRAGQRGEEIDALVVVLTPQMPQHPTKLHLWICRELLFQTLQSYRAHSMASPSTFSASGALQ